MIRNLNAIGKIKPKSSNEIKHSKISLGFEKLDRDVFDPEKAYDKTAELGVKWARIQSGWARTEKQRGVYDFEWIDKVVDNLLIRGIQPWVCLCYGNPLYTEMAKEVFGAVGCPPIFSDEEKTAWKNYVTAFVEHFDGRINRYEIWNEPDGIWCWKHGVNATELGIFTRDTAKCIKEIKPEAEVIGGVICTRNLAFLNEAFLTGMGEYLDYISFHEYTHDETKVFETVKAYTALAHMYNPKIRIIQGESGTQSKIGGHGALAECAWTEEIQAKQLARHTIADLMSGVEMASYFSCMDMIEALNGKNGDTASYLDYGYFGVLGAEFDENGKSVGTYYRKPSFYTLRNICSIFSDDYEACEIPLVFNNEYSGFVCDRKPCYRDVISAAFKKENGVGFVYWYPSNILTTSFDSVVSVTFHTNYEKLTLIDVMDGTIYEIPENMIQRHPGGVCYIANLPVKDTPLILAGGDFE